MESVWSYIRRLFRPLWDWFVGLGRLYENFNIDYDNSIQADDDGDKDDDGLSKLPHRKTIKCNIIDVIKNKNHIDIIVGKVNSVSKLRIATTHILKLYILYQYKKNPSEVNIKEILSLKFIKTLISVVSNFKARKREEALKATSTTTRFGRTVRKKVDVNYIDSSKLNFHKVNTDLEDNLFSWIKNEVVANNEVDHFLVSGVEIDIAGMGNAVNNMATEILKSFKQNVTSNYVKYVERFVNVYFKKKEKLQSIEDSKKDSKEVKKNKKNTLITNLRKIKNDLLSIENEKLECTDKVAMRFVRQYKHCVLPQKRRYNHIIYIIIIYIIIYLFSLALIKTI